MWIHPQKQQDAQQTSVSHTAAADWGCRWKRKTKWGKRKGDHYLSFLRCFFQPSSVDHLQEDISALPEGREKEVHITRPLPWQRSQQLTNNFLSEYNRECEIKFTQHLHKMNFVRDQPLTGAINNVTDTHLMLGLHKMIFTVSFTTNYCTDRSSCS